jgi:preprotein translocase subunit SecG
MGVQVPPSAPSIEVSMIWFVGTIHVIVCLVLIGVVLLQQGKSADLAGAFGGQGSQTAFGPRGAANLLTKVTTYAAIVFMFTSIGLTVLIQRSSGSRSVLSGIKAGHTTTAPAPTKSPTPAPAPAK